MHRSEIEYDNSLYESESLQNWAKMFAKALPKETTMLISAGTSGCSIATSILMLVPELQHIHIHPENRISHRGIMKNMSGKRCESNQKCVFVDDFVSMGETATKTLEAFLLYNEECNLENKLIAMLFGMRGCRRNEPKLLEKFKVPIFFANGEDPFLLELTSATI
jgi:orotate phosphoribosyltransferase-like protein